MILRSILIVATPYGLPYRKVSFRTYASPIAYAVASTWRVHLNPSKTNSRRSRVRNLRIDFRTLFSIWYKKCVWSVFRTYFASPRIVCEAPRDMPKFPQKCQKIAGGWESARFWFPTSDRLETWLIPSGTNRSRRYHESTMVWRNLPLYHLCKCLLPLCHAL